MTVRILDASEPSAEIGGKCCFSFEICRPSTPLVRAGVVNEWRICICNGEGCDSIVCLQSERTGNSRRRERYRERARSEI